MRSLVYLPLNMSDTRLARVGFLFKASFFSMIPDIICDVLMRFFEEGVCFVNHRTILTKFFLQELHAQ